MVYDIYPRPQSIEYEAGNFILDNLKLVITPGANDVIRNRIKKILNDHGINYTQADNAGPGKSLVLGIAGDDDNIINAFNAAAFNNVSALSRHDGYVLGIRGNTLFIMGSNCDALYYGIITLNEMLLQSGKTILNVLINDYPAMKNRGIVEGYYGRPWSFEARKSLIEMAGRFKMNLFIYAPKDDPYHFGPKWREPYPEAEAAKMKKLVDTARENNIEFVYTLHVGTDMDFSDEDDEINKTLPVWAESQWEQFNDQNHRGEYIPEGQREIDKYSAEETYQSFISKFEQMYSLGVRRFGILSDDINFPLARYGIIYLVPFINRIAKWCDSKGDVNTLIFCPSYYYLDDMNYNGERYMSSVRCGVNGSVIHEPLDPRVEVFFTGKTVMSNIDAEHNSIFASSKYFGRLPLIWWNYPVNDYAYKYVFLGPSPGLMPGVTNMTGIISNPMQQGFASKISLFSAASYCWNQNGYNQHKDWYASFKYLWPEIADSMREIAVHSVVGYETSQLAAQDDFESACWKQVRSLFEQALNYGLDLQAIGDNLIKEFQKILDAVADVRANSPEPGIVEDLKPWLDKLESICNAGIAVVRAYLAESLEELSKQYSIAAYEQSRWSSILSPDRDGAMTTAEIGTSKYGLKDFILTHTPVIKERLDSYSMEVK
ncbi:MAG TPA: hypothetical protein GX505_13660 [Clostridiales bacterium]|nr:hypothetical protein [Clostridiales bacterium]